MFRAFKLFLTNFIWFIVSALRRIFRVIGVWIAYPVLRRMGVLIAIYHVTDTQGEDEYTWDIGRDDVRDFSNFGWDEVFHDWDFIEEEMLFSEEFESEPLETEGAWLEEADEWLISEKRMFNEQADLEEALPLDTYYEELNFKWPGMLLYKSITANLEFNFKSGIFRSLFQYVKLLLLRIFYKIKEKLKLWRSW